MRYANILVYLLLTVFFLLVVMISLVTYYAFDLPTLAALRDYDPLLVTKVYSDDYELFGKFFEEERELLPLSEIPQDLIHAVIAAEDAQFYHHKGIDPWGILRALVKNILAQGVRQGGSTITQQVAKTFLLTKERTLARKIKEFILSSRIERNFSKDEILYLYLNQIYFGNGSYGVATAAKNYFGKEVSDLNLAEIALLSGLPQAPTLYSPYTHPDKAKKRQKYVLKRMVDTEYISHSEAQNARELPISVIPRQDINLRYAPYFLEHVRKYMVAKYGNQMVLRGGLKIYTTLSLPIQKNAETAVRNGLKALTERQGYIGKPVQGALLALDPQTGYVRALQGGYDFTASEFDRATQAVRQPGSAFKPIIYAAALDAGYTPATIIIDSPIMYDDPSRDFTWKPTNYSLTFHGDTTFRTSLVQSLNVTTIKIVQDIGIDYVSDYAQKLGIESPLTQDLSISLGSSAVTLEELVRSYAHFPSQGKKVEPLYIKRVEDRSRNILEENTIDTANARIDDLFESFEEESSSIIKESERAEELIRIVSEEESRAKTEARDIIGKHVPITLPLASGNVISPETAYIMTHLLSDVVQFGTGQNVRELGRPSAGKTGTTNEYKDAWFIGFTPELVAGVWVGFDEIETLGKGETGARAASPIWLEFMREALKDFEHKNFVVPDRTIVFEAIDPKTGKRADSKIKNTITEAFIKGTIPEKSTNAASKHTQSADDFFFEE